jgi:hypothetical protein
VGRDREKDPDRPIEPGEAAEATDEYYEGIEKAEFFKVGLIVLFLLVAIFVVLLPSPAPWRTSAPWLQTSGPSKPRMWSRSRSSWAG